MGKRAITQLGDFQGGMTPDLGAKGIAPPNWLLLENVWLPAGENLPHGRPILEPVIELGSFQGFAKTHNEELLIVASGAIWKKGANFEPLGTITVSGSVSPPLAYDISRGRTIIAAGGTPWLWNGSTFVELANFTNVESLATAQGATKERLFTLDSTKLRQINYSAIGDFSETAQEILDEATSVGVGFYTETGKIMEFPYEIIDIYELEERIVVLTSGAVYILEPIVEEIGFSPSLIKVVYTRVFSKGTYRTPEMNKIYFVTPWGVMRYPDLDMLPMRGIENTILNSLVEGEARIGVDPARRLVLLKPNETDGISWVFHLDHGIWTKWDVPIRDMITVDGVVYVAVDNDDVIYRFDNADIESDAASAYTVTIQSGLLDLGSPIHRKIFKRLGFETSTPDKVEYFAHVEADKEPVFSSTPFIQELSGIAQKHVYSGESGKRALVTLKFRSKGRFILHSLYLDHLVKEAVRLAV